MMSLAYAVVVSLQKERVAMVCAAGDMARTCRMVEALKMSLTAFMGSAGGTEHGLCLGCIVFAVRAGGLDAVQTLTGVAILVVVGDMARGRRMVVPCKLARPEVMVAAWVMSHSQLGDDDSAVVHFIRTVVARGMVRVWRLVVALQMTFSRAVDVDSFMERAK